MRCAAQGAGLFGLSAVSASFLSPVNADNDVQFTVTDLNGLKLFQGAGCNVIALPGAKGDLLVDGGLKQNSKALLNAVRDVTGNRQIQTLINTHWHPEQTGSNEAIGRTGADIIAHEKTRECLSTAVLSANYEGRYGPLDKKGLPNHTTRDRGSRKFAGQRAEYGYLPAAHSDGDLYIYFPDKNILIGGGPVASERWPMLDWRNGSWLGGLVRAHETLAGIVNPATVVVPANGKLLTGNDIVRHRDMYSKLHVTLMAEMNKGMGIDDAVKMNPLKEHESEFGDASEFLAGAFKSLIFAYVPD